MNTIEISDIALLRLAKNAITELRDHADWIRLFSKPTSSVSARTGIVNISRRFSHDMRPLLKLAVQKYGAELFRRKTSNL